MISNETTITLDNLVAEAGRMKQAGYRFVTLSTVTLEDGSTDILYHFDKDMVLSHCRLNVTAHTTIPSISGVYFSAFLAENEVKDLAGLEFDGLAVDYNRTLFLDPGVETIPLANNLKIKDKKKEKE
ncbi:NADH-quinone oxidoreductase subunit C [Desulfobacter curvatus]|uniref:NADH-quinone oxidoreductase subunit C n=1 Tax=Desulfobacter curvatus TaxID=2290 RepID=UPI0003786C42|nr:NADH-quinone oxidoreductase subunit C [Desulfobacter curvatus]